MLKTELLRKKSEMEHAEYYWKSTDGITLYAQTWLPDSKPKAVINLIHGLGEHSTRYTAWARQFTAKGYIFRSFDLRGHGRSEGKRGYSPTYQKLISDIAAFLEQGKDEFPGLPLFIYGHSLGGNLALNYAIQNVLDVKGLIITSPWFELVNKPSKVKSMIASLMCNFMPGLIVDNGLKAEDISRDLRVVHEYKNDPLVHEKISLRLAVEIIEAGAKAAVSIYKINVPLLLMHGNDDRITSCKASRNFVRNCSERTSFIEWEGGYHELHFDLDHEKVFGSILDWLNAHI
jgi:alpha-beta hydrolase superfamily lysophospholipase